MPDEFCVRGVTGSRIFVFESRNRAESRAADSFGRENVKFNSFPVCEYRDEHRCRGKEKKNLFLLQERKIEGKEKKREIDNGETVISSRLPFPPPFSSLPSLFL